MSGIVKGAIEINFLFFTIMIPNSKAVNYKERLYSKKLDIKILVERQGATFYKIKQNSICID